MRPEAGGGRWWWGGTRRRRPASTARPNHGRRKENRLTQEYIDAPPAVKLGTTTAQVGSAPPVAKDVTYERNLDAREAEPHNWITYYGAYDGKRYSLLDQINTENVKRLTPAWVFQFGSQGLHAGPSTYAFEATPIVVDGVMYVSGWDGWVWAVDAKTGKQLWQYKIGRAHV